ncbi:MAG TPA: hypothetical protein P5232_01660 [Candidatus Moranbacteria bacterium]|nr:hypothetical protein [Candidatus Moranbacteria bacterium]
MAGYIILGVIVFIFCFIIFLMLDFLMIKGGANAFWDKWVRKTLWIWLPFYALQRLIKEVILNKK